MAEDLTQESERRLSVIMFSDIVGYSKMMQVNEDQTMELLARHNTMIRDVLKKHNGTEVKVIGDAFLVSFNSVANAVRCAIEIQETFSKYNEEKPESERIILRIGIHMGDIIVKENDVFGDGVNIASRIEPLAEPGGICISQEVYNMVKHKLDVEVVSLGPRELKNIKEKIEIYQILVGSILASESGALSRLRAGGRKRFYMKPIAWVAAGFILVAAAVLIIFLMSRNSGSPSSMTSKILKIHGAKPNFPNISSDGNWVVYVDEDAFSPNLYVTHTSGGDPRKITNDKGGSTYGPCFSPDASKIIYGRQGLAESDIFIVPALGGTSRKLIGDGALPKYSPDGKHIAFFRDTQAGSGLWVANSDGSNESKITDFTPDFFRCVDWSPDSRSLAFLRSYVTPAEGRYAEIFARDLKDSSERQITFDKKTIEDFCWSTAGEIIFNSMRSGNTNLWVISEGGGTPKQLTFGAGADRVPHISRDAKQLVYLNESKTSNLWTIDLQNKQLKQVTFEDAPIYSPKYSANATKILYTQEEDGLETRRRYFVECDKDGTDPSKLSPAIAKYEISNSVWLSFDGKTIIFNAWVRDSIGRNPDSIAVNTSFFEYDLLTNAARKIGDGELLDVSRDGKYVIVAYGDHKEFRRLALKAAPDKPIRDLTSQWIPPQFSWDSKSVIAQDSLGIWMIPVEDGNSKKLIKTPKNFGFISQMPDDKTLLAIMFVTPLNPVSLVKFFPSSGKIEEIMELPPMEFIFGWTSTISPDGSTLAFVRQETKNRIVLLNNFR